MTQVSSAVGLWNAAREVTGAKNKAHILMLRTDLQHTRKGIMRMDGYLTKMKNISESLALAGSPIP